MTATYGAIAMCLGAHNGASYSCRILVAMLHTADQVLTSPDNILNPLESSARSGLGSELHGMVQVLWLHELKRPDALWDDRFLTVHSVPQCY